MPKHMEFNRDGFKFALTGDAITIYDMSTEKKINQYIMPTLEEALFNFKALYRTLCTRW